MKWALKIKESIRFTIVTIAFVIAEIAMAIGIINSSDEEMLRYIFLFVIQYISLILVIIEHLNYVVKQRENQEQQARLAETENTEQNIVE